MNKISTLSKVSQNLTIGTCNVIHENVTIHDNVKIGNNNIIHRGTTIYPNCTIGDNNFIYSENIIGEVAVESKYTAQTFIEKYNGLRIGNNNFFHTRNIIFNGYDKQTIIGDNNKILAENHIGHDTHIHNNIVLYPRCITGGHSKLLNNAVMGIYSTIQQRKTIGSYSMIGAGNSICHNIFPYYILVGNKRYIRLNTKAIPANFCIDNYRDIIHEILIKYQKQENFSKEVRKLPNHLTTPIFEFIKNS